MKTLDYKITGNINIDLLEQYINKEWAEQYIFYQRDYGDENDCFIEPINRDKYVGYCTACNEYVSFDELPKRGESMFCPCCDADVKLKQARYKYKDLGRKGYWANYAYTQNFAKGKVLRCFHLTKDYSDTSLDELKRGEFIWDEYQRFYIFNDGHVESYKDEIHNMYNRSKLGYWKKLDIRNIDYEPYINIGESYVDNILGEYFIDLEDGEYNQKIKLLDYLSRYKALRVLHKKGFYNLELDIVKVGINSIRWHQSQVNKILGFDINKLKVAKEELSLDQMKAFRVCEKEGIALTEKNYRLVRDLHLNNEGNYEAFASTGLTIKEWCKYMRNITNKSNMGVSEYLDYIKYCNIMGYDTKDTQINKPTDLQVAHDRVSDAITRLKEREKNKGFSRVVSSYRRLYEYFNNEYMIIVPQTAAAVIKEGKELHHCVGVYIDRIVNKDTVILFVRERSAPYQRFVTVEYDPQLNMIVQARADHNDKPEDSVFDFLNEWKKKIKIRQVA